MSFMVGPPPTSGYSGTLLNDLVSWWTMDDASGDRLDSHGSNDLDSTFKTVGYVAGHISGAGDFPGSGAGLYTLLTPHGLQAGARSFALSLWIEFDALGTQIPIQCGSGGLASNNDWFLEHSASRLRFYVPDGGVWKIAVANTFGAPTTATYYHVYGQYDYSTGVIGISINNGTLDTVAGPATPNDAGYGVGFGVGVGAYFNGRMDEIAFWATRVLTTDERTELYNGGAGIGYPG